MKHGKSSEDDARLFFQQIVSGVDYCHRSEFSSLSYNVIIHTYNVYIPEGILIVILNDNNYVLLSL